ncbi:substrate-binding domain-containing protein [Enterococcus mundtii]|uniref:substrate-binding domain-containing protein n=1 Tax=Enterococcus mundtii TaxID=53346 RepID=UPI0035C6CAEF
MHLARTRNRRSTEIEESQGALFQSPQTIEQKPDAWFCIKSGLAFMPNSYLQSAGYTIPDDISIICLTKQNSHAWRSHRLTNVATNLEFMGQLAIRTLIHHINHPDETDHPSTDCTRVGIFGGR